MTASDRIVLSLAWANFLLGLSAVLKFIPLGLVALQSTLGANSTMAWRWSLDLVSDTHWIFLVGEPVQKSVEGTDQSSPCRFLN